MRVAILSAMREEITPLVEYFGAEANRVTYGGNVYYCASYQGVELVLAYSKIGKVHAALSAATLILHFQCEKLIFSGVAGGISEDLRIGDLILATSLCQHDVDITAFGHAPGFIPEGKLLVCTDPELNQVAHQAAKDCGFTLKEGVIATGDQFIADLTKKRWIKETFRADALEMEGASVASVCDLLHTPCTILRAISDAADMDAGFNFDLFLVESAKKSAQLVRGMIDRLA